MVNLKELINWHPYSLRSFADFANVETDLLQAALEGEEELTAEELSQISRYVKVPIGVLLCPHLVYLEKRRPKHQKMMRALEDGIHKIWEAQKKAAKRPTSICVAVGGCIW